MYIYLFNTFCLPSKILHKNCFQFILGQLSNVLPKATVMKSLQEYIYETGIKVCTRDPLWMNLGPFVKLWHQS